MSATEIEQLRAEVAALRETINHLTSGQAELTLRRLVVEASSDCISRKHGDHASRIVIECADYGPQISTSVDGRTMVEVSQSLHSGASVQVRKGQDIGVLTERGASMYRMPK